MTGRLLVMAALALLMISAAAGCGGDSPSAVLEDFTYAQADNDCEKLIDLLTEESRNLFTMSMGEEAADPVEACKQTMEANPQEIEITNFETIEENVDGDKATVKFSITGKVDGEEMTQEETITMLKEDGQWKVSLI